MSLRYERQVYVMHCDGKRYPSELLVIASHSYRQHSRYDAPGGVAVSIVFPLGIRSQGECRADKALPS